MLMQVVSLVFTFVLLFFAFAPFHQFYLAIPGLAAWFVAIAHARGSLRAFGWGWLGGAGFFAIAISWLTRATVPGYIAFVVYLALFWGLAAAVIRACGCFTDPRGWRGILGVFGAATVWVACEWLRATAFTGFPWVLIGQSQSPLPVMTQVADFAGVFGVSFWVAAAAALLAMMVLHRDRWRELVPAGASVALLLVATLAYGWFRLAEDTTRPGLVVMVIQPNFIHERGGARLVTQEQQIDFHFGTTERALREAETRPDMIVWSETVMPPLNEEARYELRNDESGRFLASIHQRLSDFARDNNAALVAGAYFVGGWMPIDGKRTGTDIRNAVFAYLHDGSPSDVRYDKIHLVPYGEYLPFEKTIPFLYRIFKHFASYSVTYSINAAPPDALSVFELKRPAGARFVTPICFEDIDGALLARMFRPGSDGRKRADFILNITNDGWFLGNQQAQHFQASIFRAIENRAPMVRCANTGISGFIDSCGRTHSAWQIPVRTIGTLTLPIGLDERITLYTRFGNVFAIACVVVSIGMVIGRAAWGARFSGREPSPYPPVAPPRSSISGRGLPRVPAE